MTACGTTRIRLSLALVAALTALAVPRAQTPQPPPARPAPAPPAGAQTPVFRGGVEVLPLDVIVLDRDGRQVVDLTAADFQVEVDGKARRIATAEYIKLTDPVAASLARTAPAPTPAAPPDNGISTNNGGGPVGRSILVVVDQGNIRFGAARPVMQNALKFIDRMQPNDRIGVVAVPGPGEVVDFTTDHAKVREAMLRISGRLTPPRRRFNISITEAFTLYRQSDAMLISQVITRECAGVMGAADLERCERDVEQEAAEIVGDQRQQTDRSMTALRAVLRSLGQMEGQKSVILISEGLVLDGLGGDLDDIAGVAADVRASLDVLLLDVPAFDAAQAAMPTTATADRQLQEEGLMMLAGMARGTLHKVISSADSAFRRIEQSLAGYYLLGVEPGTNDRDGKRHKIDVKLARKGLTVQARRAFLSPEGPPAATPVEALKRTLRSPVTATALPLRLATWTYKEPGTSRVRLLVAAEVQRGSDEPLDYAAGLLVATKEGKVIAASEEPRALKTVEGDESLASYGGMVVVDPGTYRLRVALANAEKRTGSIEREVLAWQLNGNALTLGDLLVSPEPVGGAPLVPTVEPRVGNGALVALAEVYAPPASQAAEIGARLDIMRDETSRVLVSAPLMVAVGTSPEVRVAQGTVDVAAVPPGSYIARVSFTEGGTARGALVRPFRIVPAPAGATASARPAGGAPAELVAAVMGSLPAATKDDVLDAATTAAMWTAAEQGRTPAVLAAIKTARGGQVMDGALAALSAGDQGAAAFIRGMDFLGQAKVDQAATQFQTAMRIQSGFGAARAMLGACLLIANREKEAAGLLMGVSPGTAPALGRLAGEAWLRAGQPAAAVTPLEQVTAAAPADARAARTLALAYALSGDPAKGLPALDRYLDSVAGKKDGPALAVGVYALYRRHAGGTDTTAIAADKTKARGWARTYTATKGPLGPIVDAWASFLESAK